MAVFWVWVEIIRARAPPPCFFLFFPRAVEISHADGGHISKIPSGNPREKWSPSVQGGRETKSESSATRTTRKAPCTGPPHRCAAPHERQEAIGRSRQKAQMLSSIKRRERKEKKHSALELPALWLTFSIRPLGFDTATATRTLAPLASRSCTKSDTSHATDNTSPLFKPRERQHKSPGQHKSPEPVGVPVFRCCAPLFKPREGQHKSPFSVLRTPFQATRRTTMRRRRAKGKKRNERRAKPATGPSPEGPLRLVTGEALRYARLAPGIPALGFPS